MITRGWGHPVTGWGASDIVYDCDINYAKNIVQTITYILSVQYVYLNDYTIANIDDNVVSTIANTITNNVNGDYSRLRSIPEGYIAQLNSLNKLLSCLFKVNSRIVCFRRSARAFSKGFERGINYIYRRFVNQNKP